MQSVPADKNILGVLNPPPYQENLLTQPEDEVRLLKTLNACVKAGERYRGQYSTNWTDYTRKFVGDFYRNKQRFGFECRPNKYLEKVELQANLLTQEAFKDYVVRADESNDPDDPTPDVFQRVIKDMKAVCEYDEKEYVMLLMAGMYGPGIFKVFWNKDLQKGRGYGDVLEIDPRNFIVSPGAKNIDDAQFVCYSRPVATSELKRLYPDIRDKIKEDPGLSTNDLYGQNVVENSGYAVSDARTGAVAYLEQLKAAQGTGRPGDQCMLREFYYRDPRWITLKDLKDLTDWVTARPGFGNALSMAQEIQERTKDGFPQQVPLYPHGRVIFFVEGVKLEDHPNPYHRFPFRVWKNHIQPHVFWPKGQIELISEPISNYHLVSSSLAANWVFRSQPAFVTDDQSMDDNKYKTIKPNTLVKVGQGRKLEALAVPAIPTQEGSTILNLREGEADAVSGVSSLLAGARPQGVFAGSYFQTLQDSAFKTFGTLVKRLREFRVGVGEDFMWLAQNYLTDERTIPFKNECDEWATMSVNKPVPNTMGPTIQIGRKNDLRKGRFKYLIEEGSDQPYNMIARQSQANQLAGLMLQHGYEMPAFELILSSSGLPGAKKLLRDIQSLFQSKIQMAMQQKQEQLQILSQQRVDTINEKMASLDAKIKAAALQAGSKITSAQINKQPMGTAMMDQGVSQDDVVNTLQASVARLLQEGVSPQDLQAIIEHIAANGAAPPAPTVPPPTPGMADQNLGPQTPEIPLEPNPIPIAGPSLTPPPDGGYPMGGTQPGA